MGEIKYKAMSKDNALKQHKKYCKENGYTSVSNDTATHGVLRERLRFCFVLCKNGEEHIETFRGFSEDEAIASARTWCEKNGYASSYNANEAFFSGLINKNPTP